jgi:cytochrome c biogenesis protein CcmG/thiol:disulfide interchange protein DsbE
VGLDWGVYGVPETYVVDGHGHIAYKHVGPLTPEIVDGEILPALRSVSHP